MRDKSWWHILTMYGLDRPFSDFQWNGKGWQYRFSLATEAEVQQFIQRHNLLLKSAGHHCGAWPTQTYKERKKPQQKKPAS